MGGEGREEGRAVEGRGEEDGRGRGRGRGRRGGGRKLADKGGFDPGEVGELVFFFLCFLLEDREEKGGEVGRPLGKRLGEEVGGEGVEEIGSLVGLWEGVR